MCKKENLNKKKITFLLGLQIMWGLTYPILLPSTAVFMNPCFLWQDALFLQNFSQTSIYLFPFCEPNHEIPISCRTPSNQCVPLLL